MRLTRAWLAMLAIILLTVLSPLSNAQGGAASGELTVRIESSGAVHVALKINVSPGLTEVAAPVAPLPATITVYVNGKPAPAVYENGSIIVASDVEGTALIDYLANITRSSDGVFSVDISYNGSFTLEIEPGVVLLTMPSNIVNATVENNTLILTVTGPQHLEYTVVVTGQPQQTPAPTATTTPTPPQTTTPTPTTTPTTSTPSATTTTTATTAQTTTAKPPTTTTTSTTTVATQTGTKPRTAATTTASPPTTASPSPAQAASQATAQPTTSLPATTASPTLTPATTTAKPAAAPATTEGGGKASWAVTAGVIALIAAAIIALLLLRGRHSGQHSSSLGFSGGSSGGGGSAGGAASASALEPVIVKLDSTDRLILEKLREAGGSMYQSELQKATGLPKTTVWRHVRRLAELGYVRVEREGKYNRVVLVKMPEEPPG